MLGVLLGFDFVWRYWLFCDTPKGAAASCAAYSVVTTARACGLDDRSYVE